MGEKTSSIHAHMGEIYSYRMFGPWITMPLVHTMS
jgi:hypothetical protein